MSLTQRFGSYLHSAMQALKNTAQQDVAIRTIDTINKIAKAELRAIFTEMVQTISSADFAADIESYSSYFKGEYKQYGPLAEPTVHRKSYYTQSNDIELPLRYHGYFKDRSTSLMGVMSTMSKHNRLSQRLFDAFGGYSARSYKTENREIAINDSLYSRDTQVKRRSRTRWSDIVDPRTVDEIRRNADRYVFIRGDITKTGFYDAVNKRHISLERAIAEGRVKHPVRVKVESKLFQAVEDSEYGFTVAILPVFRMYSQTAADKVDNLMTDDRVFIDIFFSTVFERVYEKLKAVDPAFKNYNAGPL